jgi:hypothetical protein
VKKPIGGELQLEDRFQQHGYKQLCLNKWIFRFNGNKSEKQTPLLLNDEPKFIHKAGSIFPHSRPSESLSESQLGKKPTTIQIARKISTTFLLDQKVD